MNMARGRFERSALTRMFQTKAIASGQHWNSCRPFVINLQYTHIIIKEIETDKERGREVEARANKADRTCEFRNVPIA